MRFAYMDEAGNTGRHFGDENQPIHMILSLVVDESRVPELHEHVREVGRDLCPTFCEEPDFEFHGTDLFGGRGPFQGMEPADRVRIYDEVLRGIELVEGEVIVRGVHKPGLDGRYAHPFHPHDVALMFTIESIERMARSHDCQVLLVADEAKEVEDTALRDLVNYQELGTQWGWRTERIERIIDTIHFVPSHRNCAIQVADCAAFVAARLRKLSEGTISRNRSAEAIEKLWDERIEPFVRINEVWFPG
jgi:hypothetical protein